MMRRRLNAFLFTLSPLWLWRPSTAPAFWPKACRQLNLRTSGIHNSDQPGGVDAGERTKYCRPLAAAVVDRSAFVLGQLVQAVVIGGGAGRRGHGQEACGSEDRDQLADILATLHIVLSASGFVVQA